ncbi:MAG: HAD hydrolase-like protein [Terriglobales bacterium]
MFDLDGTLIDSRADLVQSVNGALRALHRDPLPEATVGTYVGDGARLLMQRALGLAPAPDRSRPPTPLPNLNPADEALSIRAVELFLAYYAEHKLDFTVLYPGVAEGLRALAATGARLAVLTNKPVRPSQAIVAHLGIAELLCAVYGGNSFEQKKPDPIGITTLRKECRAEARQTVMIGDSAVDVLAGRNAGVWTAGVSYGFSPESLQQQPPDWEAGSFAALTADLLAAMKE